MKTNRQHLKQFSIPFIFPGHIIIPNDNVAMKRAITVENDMKKRPNDLEQINDVIFKSFENGFFKWLSEEEMETYDGPVSYIPYNIVYKDSETTPARFCFDSGQVDKNGRSLNSCMGKGSNPINHFGSVILNFRGAEQVAAGDISKMFNRIQVRDHPSAYPAPRTVRIGSPSPPHRSALRRRPT